MLDFKRMLYRNGDFFKLCLPHIYIFGYIYLDLNKKLIRKEKESCRGIKENIFCRNYAQVK